MRSIAKSCRSEQVVPFSINWGGYLKDNEWGIYPSLWTAYDNCDKFSPAIFRDPSVVKFVNKNRAIEYISGKRYVAHECPNVYFIDPKEKSFSNFYGTGPATDSKDSLTQAIDIAIRLGFKHILLAGCDMYVPLSTEQVAYMEEHIEAMPADDKGRKEKFIHGDSENSLWSAIEAIAKAENRLAATVVADLDKLPQSDLYYFGDVGVPFAKKVMVDQHCFAVTNWLRQSRRCLDSLGVTVRLLSGSNGNSRLSKVFDWGLMGDQHPTLTWSLGPDYTKEPAGNRRDLPPYRKVVQAPVTTGENHE